MILITSAAYINQELQNEFGKIPPAFLPLKHKRLFEHYKYNLSNEKLFITLPISYKVDTWDELTLNNLGFNIIYLNENLSLGESVANAISSIPEPVNELKIIHGDALFNDLQLKDDCFLVSGLLENYSWGIESDSGLVYTGYFAINKVNSFLKLLITTKFDFILAVEQYKRKFSTPIIQTNSWYDFGHLTTYFKSKSNFTTERSFNDLRVSGNLVYKEGINFKIVSEVNWYKKIPTELRIYTPKLIGHNFDKEKYSYSLEFKHLSCLNELYVFGLLPLHIWREIFRSCFDVLYLMSLKKVNKFGSLREFISSKTQMRVNNSYPYNLDEKVRYKDLVPISINEIIESIDQNIPNYEQLCEVMHGDFCLSNILYDFRNQQINMIDPRGSIDGVNHTTNGFSSYDIAKLTHSIIGLYDFIISERFSILKHENENLELIFNLPDHILSIQSEYFSFLKIKGVDVKSILSICIHLFISMIPLHSDSPNRQSGFHLNIFRIYKEILTYDNFSDGRGG